MRFSGQFCRKRQNYQHKTSARRLTERSRRVRVFGRFREDLIGKSEANEAIPLPFQKETGAACYISTLKKLFDHKKIGTAFIKRQQQFQ